MIEIYYKFVVGELVFLTCDEWIAIANAIGNTLLTFLLYVEKSLTFLLVKYIRKYKFPI